MMVAQQSFQVRTRGRGTLEITSQVQAIVEQSGAVRGLCHVFLHHTSASLIICENADASVRRDLERFFARWVPDGDSLFEHTLEGDDDMPAHIRSIVTGVSLAIPVADRGLDLGTWQGIYLWEHRASPHTRRVTVCIVGADD
jgi:secondary thiamine-phosphate synthase enzyme